jgi:Mg2+ and Co2+ transporter CorA
MTKQRHGPVTGYEPEDTYYASRFRQGGRVVYSLELPLRTVVDVISKPDPHRPTEANRRINDTHARNFGKYVRENPDWIAPALLLRSSDTFKFDVTEEIAGIQFGVLRIPRRSRNDLKILDGQHRILGLHYAAEDIAAELDKQRALLAAARKQDNAELVKLYERKIRELEDQRMRMEREQISIQIYIEDDPEAYKQMFVDIADNALGITSTIRARFDHRKVVNRALDIVLDHALLKGRVDLQQDRVIGPNPHLMGAKHVAEIIRTIQVGISGRISRRQEEELREADLAEKTNTFLDILASSFSDLSDVIDGKLTPENLRKTSLLGSTTMLRVLAGVYHELVKEIPEEAVGDYFARLAPHMKAPVTEDSPWVKVPGEIFSPGTYAPKARYQDMQRLVQTIVEWYKREPAWLNQ